MVSFRDSSNLWKWIDWRYYADLTHISLRRLKSNKKLLFPFVHNICWNMGKGKVLTTVKNQKITRLLSEEMSTLEISRELSEIIER